MRIVQLSRKSVWSLSVDVLTPSSEEGRNVLPRLSCFYPSFQLLLPVLEADVFPEHNTLLSQSTPVNISFVEVTAKVGTSFFNSHLVSLNREGKRVKKSEEPRRPSVLVD